MSLRPTYGKFISSASRSAKKFSAVFLIFTLLKKFRRLVVSETADVNLIICLLAMKHRLALFVCLPYSTMVICVSFIYKLYLMLFEYIFESCKSPVAHAVKHWPSTRKIASSIPGQVLF